MTITKYLFSFTIFLFLLSFVSAISFEGTQYTFKDLGASQQIKVGECTSLNLTAEQKANLQSSQGVLGLLLHVGGEPKTDDFVFVKYGQKKENVVYHRSIFGFGVNYRNYLSDAQKNYLYVDLESIKLGDLDLVLCSGGTNTAELLEDSVIGSFKIPYFGGDNFSKNFSADNYKIGEKTPIVVELRNAGSKDANVFLFYDNEIFTKWFELKEGTPSVSKNLLPGEMTSLTYYFEPQISESFTVSPAIVRYSVNDYIFTEYSNALVSNARDYLDEIFVTLDIPNKNLDYNQEETINLKLYNDSKNEKNIILIVSGFGKLGLDEKYPISLKPLETKEMQFKISSGKEQVVTLNVSLETTDSKAENKTYDSQTVYVGQAVQNYTYVIILFVVVLILGILLYYKYLL